VCGIVGGLNVAADPETYLPGMMDLIRHRGPDDRGTYIDAAAGLALGHLRLSIIDLSSAGRQPMFNEDGQVVLVYNGEIYNFQELREQLVSAGHRFTSRTDSEVIVHGYEEWGEGVVERLCGMFAFAIWDRRDRSLFLARDPMGMKPLYHWTAPGGAFYFASEIKAFLALPEFQPRPNLRALPQFLELNFIYDEHESSLAGVRKLPAGCTLTMPRGRTRTYFTPPPVEPFAPVGAWSPDHAPELDRRTDRLYETLDRVVCEHMIADVPVGLLLSGGVDSSIVAALASRHTKVRTISMAFADSTIDERPFARIVSARLGSEHEEIVIRPEEMTADLERAVWYVDDLFGDWGVISTMLLYGKCREAGVKVVLVGEGSDELFGGYPNFEWCGGESARRHGFLRRTLRLYRWYSGRRWGRELWRFGRTVRQLYREAGGDYFSTVRLFETRRQLPHQYNMKVDKASMAVSVEARVPFLDVRVAREGYRTPRELLLREGTNKWLLRRVAERHDLLPPEIARRPKLGASIAPSWIDDVPHFRSFAREVILDRDGLTTQLGFGPAMHAYFDEGRKGFGFPSGVSIFSIVAWRLLMLNLWAREYLTARRALSRRSPAANLANGACHARPITFGSSDS
jgi:asparagine synthase (glutamine-hydrolysing)